MAKWDRIDRTYLCDGRHGTCQAGIVLAGEPRLADRFTQSVGLRGPQEYRGETYEDMPAGVAFGSWAAVNDCIRNVRDRAMFAICDGCNARIVAPLDLLVRNEAGGAWTFCPDCAPYQGWRTEAPETLGAGGGCGGCGQSVHTCECQPQPPMIDLHEYGRQMEAEGRL